MRAVVRAEPWVDRVLVYLLRNQHAAFVNALIGDQITGSIGWREYHEAGTPVPLLSLRPEEARALAEALHDYLPPTEATVAHLADARVVRDRLLALVEHTITERSA